MIAMIYLLTITHFGDYQFLMIMNVTTPIFGFPTMLIQICFHSFLIYRFFMLSRHFWITCALVSISLMAAGACAVSWWSVITYTALETRATKLLPYGLAWETSVAAADLSIAVALSWKLYTLKTSYKKTKSMLRRLIRSSLMGGCWTAALAIAGVITFGVNPQSNWILMFSAMIGRSCTLTVLYNLNARTPTAPRAVTDVTFNGFTADSRTTTGTATSPMLEMKGRRPSSPTRPDDGIMVHRDVVDLDDAGIQLPHVQRVSIVGKSEQEMV
ncbi:hypothetical protein BKA62DRAFT_230235 [Auriculariales sp. MPI-PUGE-AT-0066]|nr:hypothetical protein BKA62DRAFT_230235 [Auriculariales sp. MPI-PUGE-AT-0066]